MNANRVPGLGPPDSNKPIDRQTQREAAQRVEKVGEVDPDEQARQQRFRQIMESDETEEETEKGMPLPTPFDLSASGQSSGSDFDMDEIPDSSYSQPPTLNPTTQNPLSAQDLPQSKQFWQGADLPDQPIGKPKMQEKTGKKGASPEQKAGKDFSIAGPPGKPTEKPSSSKTGSGKGKKGFEEETPGAQYWTSENALTGRGVGKGQANQKEDKDLISAFEEGAAEEKVAQRKTPTEEFSLHERKAFRDDKEKKQSKGHEKKENVQIMSPSIPELPASIQPAAVAATQSVAAYLRPETVPLFYQMVGSIIVMSTPPGISRTEFILNNPAFANSKFFGATVELIKYSTAPDSYNIRLSGSNEAVAAFNQNLPNLMAAFQTGHFSFRIGRIDAEYANDRPVLRRKEGTEEGGQGESKHDQRQQ